MVPTLERYSLTPGYSYLSETKMQTKESREESAETGGLTQSPRVALKGQTFLMPCDSPPSLLPGASVSSTESLRLWVSCPRQLEEAFSENLMQHNATVDVHTPSTLLRFHTGLR